MRHLVGILVLSGFAAACAQTTDQVEHVVPSADGTCWALAAYYPAHPSWDSLSGRLAPEFGIYILTLGPGADSGAAALYAASEHGSRRFPSRGWRRVGTDSIAATFRTGAEGTVLTFVTQAGELRGIMRDMVLPRRARGHEMPCRLPKPAA